MSVSKRLCLSDFLEKSAQIHKHLCPKQVLGVRMGIMAGELLNFPPPQTNNKRIFVFMETDGCTATGVAVATGCSIYRRTMRIMDYGKVAITCVDTLTNRAYRILPHKNSRQRAQALQPNAKSRWHAYLYAYQQMPTDHLLTAYPVTISVDLAQIISKPTARTNCDDCGEEIMNQREVIEGNKILCQSCVGNRYYLDVTSE